MTSSQFPVAAIQRKHMAMFERYRTARWSTISSKFVIPGSFSVTACRSALKRVAEVSEALRTQMVRISEDTWEQRILDIREFMERAVDITDFREEALDNTHSPPVDPYFCSSKICLLRKPDRLIAVVNVHHSVCDALGLDLIGELLHAAFYTDPREPLTSRAYGETNPADMVQPRMFASFEQSSRSSANGAHWSAFHSRRVERIEPARRPELGVNDECELAAIEVLLTPDVGRLMRASSKLLGVSATTLTNGLALRYVQQFTDSKELTLKTLVSNRHIPRLRTSVANVANEVWVRIGTQDCGTPGWYRQLHMRLLGAYTKGIYNWDAVRTSANFFEQLIPIQHASTNITIEDGDAQAPVGRLDRLDNPLAQPMEFIPQRAPYVIANNSHVGLRLIDLGNDGVRLRINPISAPLFPSNFPEDFISEMIGHLMDLTSAMKR